jgi:hypothetical protein
MKRRSNGQQCWDLPVFIQRSIYKVIRTLYRGIETMLWKMPNMFGKFRLGTLGKDGCNVSFASTTADGETHPPPLPRAKPCLGLFRRYFEGQIVILQTIRPLLTMLHLALNIRKALLRSPHIALIKEANTWQIALVQSNFIEMGKTNLRQRRKASLLEPPSLMWKPLWPWRL